MAIIQKIIYLFKKKNNLFLFNGLKTRLISKSSPVFLISFILIFFGVFFISSNYLNNKHEENVSNLKEITKTDEFSNFAYFFFSKINSPYEEVEYVIKNNDTIEKILKI